MLLTENSKGKKKEELRENTAFLEIDLDKLQQLPKHIQLELMFYGLTVLLQRETASLTFYLTMFRQNIVYKWLTIADNKNFLSHNVQTKQT